ncbi:MAG: UDP-N-acetylmuramoyl-L-alanine--D-glutamate ligase [Planctomycetes bacterium]|nr:UDP-N-acetylmuramoyl-L-alanine--D-glutamate ligase [Planctomycetota bacterium]
MGSVPILPYTFPADAELKGRRVLVMGLGLFQGGAAVVRFLVARGAEVVVTDLRSEEALAPTLAELRGVPFARVLGGHRTEDFLSADLVVVNPAVPADSLFLEAAQGAGVPLTSEVGLCLARLRARLVLVTGSKGKTTTATLLERMLLRAGQTAVLGGNVGASLLSRVDRLTRADTAVFEISSFQLDQLRGLPRAPECVVITNLFPVHLDRHGTFEAYCAAKRSALEGARSAVLNHGDARLCELAAGAAPEDVTWFSAAGAPPRGFFSPDGKSVRAAGGEEVLRAGELLVPGAHNVLNAMAALAAAERLGAPRAAALAAARDFPGVEHRLEFIGERRGVRLVNDSIATTPQSTLAALAALEGPLVLIAGGKDSGCDLAALAAAIGARVRVLVVAGESGPRLAQAVGALPDAPLTLRARDFAAAVGLALAQARPGETVLLSPAFPSYDLFRNFRERGEAFRRLAGR